MLKSKKYNTVPTINSRKSDGRKKQTIGGRGPKSSWRRDVSGARELPKVAYSGASVCSG